MHFFIHSTKWWKKNIQTENIRKVKISLYYVYKKKALYRVSCLVTSHVLPSTTNIRIIIRINLLKLHVYVAYHEIYNFLTKKCCGRILITFSILKDRAIYFFQNFYRKLFESFYCLIKSWGSIEYFSRKYS